MIDKTKGGFHSRVPKRLRGLETVLLLDLLPLLVYIHMYLCTYRYIDQKWTLQPRAKALVANLDLSFHLFRRRAPKRARAQNPVEI